MPANLIQTLTLMGPRCLALQYQPTPGVEFHFKSVPYESQLVGLQFWDVCGTCEAGGKKNKL